MRRVARRRGRTLLIQGGGGAVRVRVCSVRRGRALDAAALLGVGYLLDEIVQGSRPPMNGGVSEETPVASGPDEQRVARPCPRLAVGSREERRAIRPAPRPVRRSPGRGLGRP
jgi:hypothetical protein